MAAPGGLEKDFGYLMPFLDKVAAAASGVTDTAARAELQRLVSEEKARWQRIRTLLGGAPGAAPGAAAAAAPARKADGGTALTVGSLRPR